MAQLIRNYLNAETAIVVAFPFDIFNVQILQNTGFVAIVYLIEMSVNRYCFLVIKVQ